MKHLFSTIFLLFAVVSISFAQPDNNKKVIQLTNGNEYIGTIISDDGREMLFESTAVGKIYIKKTDIKSITNYKEDDFVIINDEKVKSNPFSTRYSFTTNALPIKKKENYYMINLWGPEFHVAVADNFNVGIMTSWIGSPFAIAAKYSFQTKNPKLNFSLGEIVGNGGYIDPSTFLSLSFGNVTFGDREKNLTFGLGYGYFDFNQTQNVPGTYPASQYVPQRSKPASQGIIGSLAASVRINEKTSFVFDSMFGLMKANGTTTNYNYDSWTQTGTLVVTANKNDTPFFVFMPALRRSQGDGRAIQFTLAGINTNYETTPIPFVSWYRTL